MTIESIDAEIVRLTKLRDSLEAQPTEGQRSLEEIMAAAANRFGVNAGLMRSRIRTKIVADARRAFALIAGQSFLYSHRRIAYQLNQRTSSVSIGTMKAGDFYNYDPKFRSMVDDIKKALGL